MFTKPEIEAAMQLIQLSGDSNVDVQSYDVSNSLCEALTITDTKKKEVVCDDDVDESQGSCTSDMTSVTKSVRPYFLDEDKVVGRKRKRRSIVEIYSTMGNEILTHILGKPTDEATSSDPSPPTAEWLKIDFIAREALDLIAENFNDNKRTRSIALKAELRSLKLCGLTIDAYFRFPEKYENVYGIIVHREPFPDLKRVRSMLTTKGTRLKSMAQATSIDSTSSSPMVLLATSGPSKCCSGKDYCFIALGVFYDRSRWTPIDTKSELEDDGDLVSDPTLYWSLAGPLMYLTSTHLDISYTMQQSSKRQPTLSQSSVETEYRGVSNDVAETCWLRNLLRELYTPLSYATLVYCDNVSVVYPSSNPVQHQLPLNTAYRSSDTVSDLCMTRSSTKELFTPFKDPEQEFRSSRKHFKTLSLDESRSPNFYLFSDQEEYSEEEVAETMAETMKQYMSKTRANYGSGVDRPKIEDKDNFELKGQFLKELRTNTFSGSDHEDMNEHIEKVLEIVDLFHIPNITIDQVMLRAFYMSLTRAASRWLNNKPSGCEQCKVPYYTKDFHSMKKGNPSKKLTTLNLVHLFKEGDIEKLLWDSTKGTMQTFRASVSVMPLSTYLNLGLGELAHTNSTVELADWTVKYPKGVAENVQVRIGKFVFLVYFIILDMPEDIKVPLILGRLFLSTAHAKIDVFKRKITLRVGEEKIIFKSVKLTSSLIKRVYTLCLRERMELDLEARLMGETLVLNRSLDHFFGDYIILNNLNVPLELRRDQVDDLMPTIDEGKVVEEFRARNDAKMVSKDFGYPSDCDHDKKICINCAHNLKFSFMIVLEHMNAYRDEGTGDVIFGEPFLREVEINARRFGGMITIYNGNEEVTY
nr:hypothetical protein [Tanacetum cinerariifolium]